MEQTPLAFDGGGDDGGGDALTLAHYAERAYLEYALSVVKGRALPDVVRRQKPVQRRILYAMTRMGLAFTDAARRARRRVKSARVVGDVLGSFHPHGDQAAYDALVRMAQDFALRYPLIDGQGNFGSRDGDGAAAMRYTEARLNPIARLLLDEIDEGTVDFMPELRRLDRGAASCCPRACRSCCSTAPAASPSAWPPRCPSHNLREVADAAVALLKNDKLSDDELYAADARPRLPGRRPDHQQRRRTSATPTPPAAAASRCARAGRSRTSRAASGSWSSPSCRRARARRSVLEEIEELTNPKIKAGKKALERRAAAAEGDACSSVLDAARDESSRDAAGAPRLRAEEPHGRAAASSSTRCSPTPASRARRRST